MNESTTIKFRLIRRSWRAFTRWLRLKLLQALGVDREIRDLQARVFVLVAQLDQVNELLRELSCPSLPQEFFDDTEILVTQRYDG